MKFRFQNTCRYSFLLSLYLPTTRVQNLFFLLLDQDWDCYGGGSGYCSSLESPSSCHTHRSPPPRPRRIKLLCFGFSRPRRIKLFFLFPGLGGKGLSSSGSLLRPKRMKFSFRVFRGSGKIHLSLGEREGSLVSRDE
jgi:hypothetical protein